jgi:CDP-glycerol glycerophosphotransferase (TagB/SpsB family)
LHIHLQQYQASRRYIYQTYSRRTTQAILDCSKQPTTNHTSGVEWIVEKSSSLNPSEFMKYGQAGACFSERRHNNGRRTSSRLLQRRPTSSCSQPSQYSHVRTSLHHPSSQYTVQLWHEPVAHPTWRSAPNAEVIDIPVQATLSARIFSQQHHAYLTTAWAVQCPR